MNPEKIAAALAALPMHEFDSLAKGSGDEPPEKPGFYAWWQRSGALPGVPGAPHPTAPLELLYVGIVPGRQPSAGRPSARDLRARLGEHHHGAVGSSTFRRALTAFLWEASGWTLDYRAKHVVLEQQGLIALSEWQRTNLMVQWIEVEDPWRPKLEATVIKLMQPPLNHEHNKAHPFWTKLDMTRKKMTAASKLKVS